MIGLLALTLAAGCGSADPVKLTVADDGRQIEIGKGQMLAVTLEANPSTGYRWDWVPTEAGILKQSGEAEFAQGNAKGLVGATELQTLLFEAADSGTTQLQLVYHRPWEEDADPGVVFAVTVVVR